MKPSSVLAAAIIAGFGIGAGARFWKMAGQGASVMPGETGARGGRVTVEGAAAAPRKSSPPSDPQAGLVESPPLSESVESVLQARGFEQAERLGRFLIAAAPADLERLLIGLHHQYGRLPMTLGDAIFLRWMQLDPRGGLAIADRLSLGSMAWWAWGKTDGDSALSRALTHSEDWPGTAVLRALAQSDPLKARVLLDEHPRFRSGNAMGGLADGLMKSDPAAGATLAAAWNGSVNNENLLTNWARREPEAALAWALALPDQSRRAEALSVLVKHTALHHPDRVASTITELPNSQTKWKLYAEHAARLAALDPAAAQTWVDAAPNPRVRQEATLEMARGLASSDPSAALTLLRSLEWLPSSGSMDPPPLLKPDTPVAPEMPHLPPAVLDSIGRAAPAETLEFISSLPPFLQADGANLIYRSWLERDALAASQWLAEQPEGVVKSEATHALVRELVRGSDPDYEAAFRWSLTLTDPASRSSRAGQIIDGWQRLDPEAVRHALSQPGVPEEVRARFQTLPPSP